MVCSCPHSVPSASEFQFLSSVAKPREAETGKGEGGHSLFTENRSKTAQHREGTFMVSIWNSCFSDPKWSLQLLLLQSLTALNLLAPI